jgi:murein DD-endopeptidase MepM/ murein hydrolase activator NlpD
VLASALAPAHRARAQATAQRYWPVVTAHPDWDVISAEPDCHRLRCFGAPRPVSRLDNPTRRHAGVDLFARAGDTVVAVENGVLVNFYPFLRARTGEMSYALLLAHNGFVANYGEVRATALSEHRIAPGDTVHAGQAIATVSDTAQLHFETYLPDSSHNSAWRYGAPRPASVLDPTPLLIDLAQRGTRILPH